MDSYGPAKAGSVSDTQFNDFLKEMDSMPLFMKSIPDASSDLNPATQALQALAYDGTPEEIALNFKNQGNDCFKMGKKFYPDAIEYYSKALAQSCSDANLNATVHVNRAAVHLALGNYRKAIQDSEDAIKLDPSLVKAYFRAAKAYGALEKYPLAIDFCHRGLAVDPNNEVLKNCCGEMKLLQKKVEELESRRHEVRREQKMKEFQLKKALELRGIQYDSFKQLLSTPAPFSPVHLNQEGHLVWPVCFLYPEFKETDIVSEFDELSTVGDHLRVMFEQPPPWSNSYTFDKLEVFVEREKKGGSGMKELIPLEIEETLAAVLNVDGVVVQNGVPSIVVLLKNSDFGREFKGRYANVSLA